MYYHEDYIKYQVDIFAKKGKTDLYSKKGVRKYLELEGEFVRDLSDKFIPDQEKRFPMDIIRNFLAVYPQLRKSRYSIEKEFILREMDMEGYLVGATDEEIFLFTEYYEKGVNRGGVSALKDIKTQGASGNAAVKQLVGKILPVFTLTDPLVGTRLRYEAGRRITHINETTRKLIVNKIIFAYDAGGGYDDIKGALQDLFASWKAPKGKVWFTNKRAEMIARTELATAVSWARQLSYEKRGVKRKSWLAEVTACPVCSQNMGDGIIGFNQTFSSGHLREPAHPNCRCVTLPEVELDDYLNGYTWHGEAENDVHTQT